MNGKTESANGKLISNQFNYSILWIISFTNQSIDILYGLVVSMPIHTYKTKFEILVACRIDNKLVYISSVLSHSLRYAHS